MCLEGVLEQIAYKASSGSSLLAMPSLTHPTGVSLSAHCTTKQATIGMLADGFEHLNVFLLRLPRGGCRIVWALQNLYTFFKVKAFAAEPASGFGV